MGARSLRLGSMAVVNRTVSWLRANPLVADGLLAAVFVVAAIVIGIVAPVPDGEREIGVLGWILLIGNTAPIAARRVWPLISAWTVLGANLPYWVLDYPDDPIGPTTLIAVYSVGAHVARPVSLRNGIAMISLIVAVGTVGVIVPEEDLPWYAIPAFIVMYGTAWILGDNLRTRRAYRRVDGRTDPGRSGQGTHRRRLSLKLCDQRRRARTISSSLSPSTKGARSHQPHSVTRSKPAASRLPRTSAAVRNRNDSLLTKCRPSGRTV